MQKSSFWMQHSACLMQNSSDGVSYRNPYLRRAAAAGFALAEPQITRPLLTWKSFILPRKSIILPRKSMISPLKPFIQVYNPPFFDVQKPSFWIQKSIIIHSHRPQRSDRRACCPQIDSPPALFSRTLSFCAGQPVKWSSFLHKIPALSVQHHHFAKENQ